MTIPRTEQTRTHINAIRPRCHEIDAVLGMMADRQFPDEVAMIDTGEANLRAILRHAEALAALAEPPVDRDWWGVAPRSVDYARRHPWEVIPCASRQEAERVHDEQDERENWIIVLVRQVITVAG